MSASSSVTVRCGQAILDPGERRVPRRFRSIDPTLITLKYCSVPSIQGSCRRLDRSREECSRDGRKEGRGIPATYSQSRDKFDPVLHHQKLAARSSLALRPPNCARPKSQNYSSYNPVRLSRIPLFDGSPPSAGPARGLRLRAGCRTLRPSPIYTQLNATPTQSCRDYSGASCFHAAQSQGLAPHRRSPHGGVGVARRPRERLHGPGRRRHRL